jgi:hypothetical protein
MQTTYSTLQVSYDEYEQPKSSNLRKVTVAAAVLCSVVVMFFAGRVYETNTMLYSHDEVVAISAKCGEGEFIGGCVGCKSCADYEYENGGCTYFKDAFCSYCEPIMNCQRENILCTTREDQVCVECDCNDPVVNWTDVELGLYLRYDMASRDAFAGKSQEQATFSCYWNEDCRPCTVCPFGEWETARCTQTSDTVCQACAECGSDQWVSEACHYASDTVCTDCTHFQGAIEGSYTSTLCHKWSATTSMYEGFDASNTECTICNTDAQADTVAPDQPTQFYSQICNEYGDSECTDCSQCDNTRNLESIGGEYIRGGDDSGICISGDPGVFGRDTVCIDCTDATDMPGFWEEEECLPTGTTDAVWTLCTTCGEGEWEHTPCRLSSDTICPPCYPVNHCLSENTMCSEGTGEDANDSECVGPGSDSMDLPKYACEDDFYGKQCAYLRTFGDCASGPGYRERTVRTGKFRGETNGEFINWCMMMCDEFPDCLAFQIGDGGNDMASSGTAEAEADSSLRQILTKPNALCTMMDVPMGSALDENENPTIPTITTKDCFSNIRRQREDLIRAIIEQVDGAPLAEEGKDIYLGVGALPMAEGDWKEAWADNVMMQRGIEEDARLEALELTTV